MRGKWTQKLKKKKKKTENKRIKKNSEEKKIYSKKLKFFSHASFFTQDLLLCMLPGSAHYGIDLVMPDKVL